MSRTIRSINHRKCHRSRKVLPDKYDIQLKRLDALEHIFKLRRSMPINEFKSTERYLDYQLHKQKQGHSI